MTRANVFASPYEYDDEDPPGWKGAINRVGKDAGGTELIVKAFELPAGERLCPYHYEYVEEWLILLSGTLTLRTPEATEELLVPGDVVRFAAGPDGAHQVTNPESDANAAPARFVMFSSAATPSVAVYPDSDKVGVWTDNDADDFMFRRGDGKVPYYDGEA
jgi:uncharacterized cupin superfamily protein